MGKMRIRHLYRDRGDHLSFRDVSEYVVDPRDLDEHGNPPPWFATQKKIEAEAGEIEFDHAPTADELKSAFPEFFAREAAKIAEDK